MAPNFLAYDPGMWFLPRIKFGELFRSLLASADTLGLESSIDFIHCEPFRDVTGQLQKETLRRGREGEGEREEEG